MRHRLRAVAGCVGAVGPLIVPAALAAAERYWDPDPAAGIQGGSGSWNKTLSYWDIGGTLAPWQDSSDALAVFGGASGGTVNVRANITGGALRFDTSGYTLQGAYELRLDQGSIAANVDAAINNSLNIPGTLLKSGAGTLSLGASNTIGNNLQIFAGVLAFSEDAQLGKTTNDVQLTGGALRYTGASTLAWGSGRKLIVDPAGGAVDVSSHTLALMSASQLAGSGTLQKLGAAQLSINASNTGFTGQVHIAQGILGLAHAQSIGARPVTISSGTLALLNDDSTSFGSEVTVQGDSAIIVDRYSAQGPVLRTHQVAALHIESPAALTVSGSDSLAAASLDVLGSLRINNSAVKVLGNFSGSGTARFGAATRNPANFELGLLFSGGAARSFAGSVIVDDAIGARGVIGVESGGTLQYQGAWQGGAAQAQNDIVLRGGSGFTVGPAAIINTTAPDFSMRPWRVIGDGPANTFELAANFISDHTLAGAAADGWGALEVSSATLVSRSSAGLPRIVRSTASGTVRAGVISFSGSAGPRWIIADVPQCYEGQILFNSSATLETSKTLTHAGLVAGGIDAQFQAPLPGVTIDKTGPAWLVLAGSQGYAAGTQMRISGGGVRFESDPGAGYFAGNFSRAPDGSVTPPAPSPALVIVAGGTATGSVEFAAPVARIASLAIHAGSDAKILAGAGPGARAVLTGSLDIDETGRFDLGDGRLVIDYPAASPLQAVRALVQRGYNAAGPHWQSGGITSTVAQADPSLAIGYAEASAVLGIAGAQTAPFGPATADATSIVLRLTRAGDANLDGQVNFIDLVAVAQNYNAAGTGLWNTGDFNYDGDVNFIDLVMVAQSYGSGLPGAPAAGDFAQDWAAATASVPEPRVLPLVAAAALLGCHRRRGAMTRTPRTPRATGVSPVSPAS